MIPIFYFLFVSIPFIYLTGYPKKIPLPSVIYGDFYSFFTLERCFMAVNEAKKDGEKTVKTC